MNVTLRGKRQHHRTVSFDALSNSVVLIEQRLLPHEFRLVKTRDYRETAEAITTMVVRGAGAIGATAAYGLAQGARAFRGSRLDRFETHIEAVYQTLKHARPTAVDPVNAMNAIREEMAMDLRRSVERLEVELNSARNILKSFTLFAGTADSFTVTSRADQLVFSVPAYDDNNNPLFLPTGELLSDVVAISIVDDPEVKIERLNPVSKIVETLPLKKIETDFLFELCSTFVDDDGTPGVDLTSSTELNLEKKKEYMDYLLNFSRNNIKDENDLIYTMHCIRSKQSWHETFDHLIKKIHYVISRNTSDSPVLEGDKPIDETTWQFQIFYLCLLQPALLGYLLMIALEILLLILEDFLAMCQIQNQKFSNLFQHNTNNCIGESILKVVLFRF